MSKDKKRTKKYNPRNRKSFQSLLPLVKDQRRDLGLMYHITYQSIINGAGSYDDFECLAVASNIALILAEKSKNTGYLALIIKAQEALMRCMKRGEELNRWVLDGPGIVAVATMLDIHDEQLAEASKGAVSGALTTAKRRMQDGHTMQITNS